MESANDKELDQLLGCPVRRVSIMLRKRLDQTTHLHTYMHVHVNLDM